jgi:ribosomal protein S18 acetylase RimI-like enzyme
MVGSVIRPAIESDRKALRAAIVELQEHERRLSDTRLPGEAMADAYLAWMLERAEAGGAVFVAEIDGAFAGFAAGWVEENTSLAETADTERYGFVSDLCVLPAFRRRGLAGLLIAALEAHLARAGVARVRLYVLAANEEARAAYERAGYAPYEVVYEKTVGPDAE